MPLPTPLHSPVALALLSLAGAAAPSEALSSALDVPPVAAASPSACDGVVVVVRSREPRGPSPARVPMSGVELEWRTADAGSWRTRTDSAGAACLPFARRGSLHVRRLGFAPLDQVITLSSVPGRSHVELELTPLPQRLPPVHRLAVRAARRSFRDAPDASSPSALTGTLPAELRAAIPTLDEPDPLRSLALAAPVSVRGEFTPGVGAYGAAPDQTAIEIDGLPVLSVQHMGGLFTTLPHGAVGDVQVSPASATASAGGMLGGVVSVGFRHDVVPGIHGEATSSPIASSLALRTASSSGAVRTLVAGRLSTIAWLSDRVRPGSFPYRFHDVVSHLEVGDAGERELALTVLEASDAIRYPGSPGSPGVRAGDLPSTATEMAWRTRFVGARAGLPVPSLPSGSRLSIRAAHTLFDASFALSSVALELVSHVQRDLADASLDVPLRRAGAVTATLAGGVGVGRSTVRSALAQYGAASDALSSSAAATSAWVELASAPDRALGLRLGVRGESVPAARWASVMPRLGVAWTPGSAARFDLSLGRTSQWMHSTAPNGLPGSPTDLWMVAGGRIPVAVGAESVIGVSLGAVPATSPLRLVAWIRELRHLPDRPVAMDPSTPSRDTRAVDARSSGVDVRFVPRLTEGWTVLLGYTLSRSERRVIRSDTTSAGLVYDTLLTWPSPDDRRHIGTALVTWGTHAGTTLTVAWQLHSGAPQVMQTGAAVVRQPVLPLGPTLYWPGDPHPSVGPNATIRLPVYSRLDLRAARRWTWGDDGATGRRALDIHAAVLNVTNRANPLQYEWDFTVSPAITRLRTQLPILPSLGVSLTF